MKINPWMFSHHGVLYSCSCCVGFPFRVLWWSTAVLWFWSLVTMLSLCISWSYTHLFSWTKKLHEREVCSTLVARMAPEITDVIQMRETCAWRYYCMYLRTPNMGPPGKISIKGQKLNVFKLQFRWHYWRAIYYRAKKDVTWLKLAFNKVMCVTVI